MRVVLDTGILLAALITTDTPPELIYRSWRKKRFELVSSEWQLEEFRRASRYPKMRRFLRASDAGTLVNALRQQAWVLESLPELELSPDPDDNPVLAMAVSSNADYLITGDKIDLLALRQIGMTQILAARQFVERLRLGD